MKLLALAALAWAVFNARLGTSSWYGESWDGEETANGEAFDHSRRTLAHKTWPMNRWCFCFNLANGRGTWAWLNDRGPYIEGREFDLSEAAAADLGFLEDGLAQLLVIRF